MMADVTFERPTGDRRVGRLMDSAQAAPEMISLIPVPSICSGACSGA